MQEVPKEALSGRIDALYAMMKDLVDVSFEISSQLEAYDNEKRKQEKEK